jgi:dihydrofolate synthase/folylpolyglutamate synthase
MMTVEEAMQFWFGRTNFEQRSAEPSDLKLDRMRHLLELLGNPHERLRIVHIAGSKGKGSTSAMLAAILRRAGYRTGLFTSPHLVSVEERIQVDDQPISRDELRDLLQEIHATCARSPGERGEMPLGQELTFFEIATAVGFLHFVRRGVEVAVVEVGLGGRFDSTNVCQPLVSIITSISFDHTQQLGNTLAQIAMEKAGIVKPGRPVISGVRAAEPRRVIEEICRERGAPLSQLDGDVTYTHEPAVISPEQERRPRIQVVTRRRRWPTMELGLLGEHQAANAALAVAAVEQLHGEGLSIPDEAVGAGLSGVHWPARLEIVGRRPWVILDCAHNVASAEALVRTLLTSFKLRPASRRLLVFAGSRDKDLPGMMRVLTPHFAHLYLTPFANSPRAVPPEQLAQMLPSEAEWRYSLHPVAADAWHAARAAAEPDDLICVTGSVFLAGELRPLLMTSRVATPASCVALAESPCERETHAKETG